MTVAIIDSGGSNLRSVAKAIDRLNKSYVITDIADEIMKASFVILPGVGSAESRSTTAYRRFTEGRASSP